MVEMSNEELLPLFPEGTVTEKDLPELRRQIQAGRMVATTLDTPAKAFAAGYVNTTSDVPYMGQHYLNFDLVRDGIFDPAKPEGLLFSKIDGGEEKLVGVWYLQVPGIGGVTREVEPAASRAASISGTRTSASAWSASAAPARARRARAATRRAAASPPTCAG